MAYTGVIVSNITVIARYSYYAHNEDELSFKKGERFCIIEKSTSHGWFVVERISSGERGLAPGNYFKKDIQQPQQHHGGLSNSPTTSPRKEECVTTTNSGIVDDDNAPPLPGPAPKWSGTGTNCLFNLIS